MNWYLFSGYAVFWLLIFFYILYAQRKQQKLSEELKALSEQLDR